VDTASNRCSVAVIESDTRTILDTKSVGPLGNAKRPEERIERLHRDTRAMLDTLADTQPPAIVLIERPRGGRNGQDVLLAGWAVITSAAVTVANRHGGIVQWVEIGTWRARAGLFSRAVREGHDKLTTDVWKRIAASMAKDAGYNGDHVDEADAVCIALAACRVADDATVTKAAA
jgi:hypothetical protein